jgi:peptidoglycan hydrolase FlgJ
LQKAGYATDPEYADKLSRAINTTLQLRRVQV